MAKTFVVHPRFEHLKTELQQALDHFSDNNDHVVKAERNTIKKLTIDDKTFNIKSFKSPNFFQSLVYRFLRKSKARRSFEHALKLIDLDILTPFPVAYAEHFGLGLTESFYISEQLEYELDFRVLNHNPKYPERDKILEEMAAFTFKLHENNINFLDHSPGNTLIKKNDRGEWDFYLIDLNRMRFETLSLEKRMHNFRRLWLSKTMINVMSRKYAELMGVSVMTTHKLMTKYSRAFQKKVNSKKIRKRKRR